MPTTPTMQAFSHLELFIATQLYCHNVGRPIHSFLMRRLLALAAAATAATFPSAALAVTSGNLRGEVTVPYSCDMTLPTTQTMVVSGTTAAINGVTIGLQQNADTDYSVSTLAITEPAAATTTGQIVVKRASEAVLVTADGTGSPDDTQTATGVFAESGLVDYSQTETVLTAMASGNYAVQTTITCSESGGGF